MRMPWGAPRFMWQFYPTLRFSWTKSKHTYFDCYLNVVQFACWQFTFYTA